MQTILSLGNALNHGTARGELCCNLISSLDYFVLKSFRRLLHSGSAVGFRLDSLLKLTDTRARNNKMTLMHYLCKVNL